MIDKRHDTGAAALFGRAYGMWNGRDGLHSVTAGHMSARLRVERRDEQQPRPQGISALERGNGAGMRSTQTYSPENERLRGAVGARPRIPTLKP